MSTSTNNSNIETILAQLSKDDLLALIKRMVQLYPDLAELVKGANASSSTVPSQPHVSFNAEFYREKVQEVFYETDRDTWGSEARAAGPLYKFVEIASDYVRQKDYASAATLNNIIVQEIIYNYDSFRWHAEEGELDEVIRDCVKQLGVCLREEKRDVSVRQQIIKTLREVYTLDSDQDSGDLMMARNVPSILTRYTTPEERVQLAQWLRKTFKLDTDWYNDDVGELYENDSFLLGLEADTLGDEVFQRVCEESGSYTYLVERFLARGRVGEAMQVTTQAEDYDIIEIADIFVEHGYEKRAEQLIKERITDKPGTLNAEFLSWLKTRYEAGNDLSGALDMATRLFRASPMSATIERCREIRKLAQSLNQWETVRAELLTYLQQTKNIGLQIEVALDEERVEDALTLLKSGRKEGSASSSPFGSVSFDVGLQVAKAAEKNYPDDAIEIYALYVETYIAWRNRSSYQKACQNLLSIRNVYQRMHQEAKWKSYIAHLREQYRRLPALQDEMNKAKL